MAQADDDQAQMQRYLNGQILSRPFNVPDQATLNAELGAATERGRPTRVNPAPPYHYYGGYYTPYYSGWGAGYNRPYYRSYYHPYYWNY